MRLGVQPSFLRTAPGSSLGWQVESRESCGVHHHDPKTGEKSFLDGSPALEMGYERSRTAATRTALQRMELTPTTARHGSEPCESGKIAGDAGTLKFDHDTIF